MFKLPIEVFLALRYLRPRRTFVSVITIISILGVTLGVAVLIVVISVMSGFDREWRNRILGFNAHMKVFKLNAASGELGPMEDFTRFMTVVASNRHVTGVSPFVTGQILLKTQPPEGMNPRFRAPILLGIDVVTEGSVSVLPTNIVDGEFDVSGTGLLVGRAFARAMSLRVNDRVAVYSPGSLEKMERSRGSTNETAVLADEYTVRGIFDVGFAEYNSMIVVSSLENAQQLYDLPEDSVHGLQVKLTDAFHADMVRGQLMPHLGRDFFIQTWQEESPEIFNALATEKSMMFFLLFFIMIVAGFGIINSQITFVVQKTQEIGILKALGATDRQILWVFLSQSVVIGLLGVSTGLGLALLAVQNRNALLDAIRRTGFDPLPASIYQIYELPAAIHPGEVLTICCAAFVACVLAGLFPAWKASRLQPVEALRYE